MSNFLKGRSIQIQNSSFHSPKRVAEEYLIFKKVLPGFHTRNYSYCNKNLAQVYTYDCF